MVMIGGGGVPTLHAVAAAVFAVVMLDHRLVAVDHLLMVVNYLMVAVDHLLLVVHGCQQVAVVDHLLLVAVVDHLVTVLLLAVFFLLAAVHWLLFAACV